MRASERGKEGESDRSTPRSCRARAAPQRRSLRYALPFGIVREGLPRPPPVLVAEAAERAEAGGPDVRVCGASEGHAAGSLGYVP